MCVSLTVAKFMSCVIHISTDVYLSLNGEVIPNHGYVEISDIGSNDITALLCHTNRPAHYGGHERPNSGGYWVAPDGTKVGGLGSTDVPGFRRNRGPMVVRLRRWISGTPDEGIYRCSLNDAKESHQRRYIGLYNTGGGKENATYDSVISLIPTGVVSLSGGMTFTLISDSQFILTCVSTGGPATTVIWTRDSAPAVGRNETDIVDGVTGTSNNTLLVTGRMEGLYTCTVSNRVSTESSASLTVAGEDHTLSQLLSHFSSPPLTSSLSSLWCDGVSEWTEQSTSHLDTISWTQCHWLHHFTPRSRWRREWLSGGWGD